MPIFNWHSIPGYTDAIKRESGSRDASFLSIDATIAGIKIGQLTPERFLLLDGVSSPFVTGGTPKPEDVALLLWICSNGFSTTDRKARDKFVRGCRKVSFEKACQDIAAYIKDAFADAPGGRSGSASYYSWCASMVDIIASEYHWGEREIMQTPLKRLFQYIRAICMRNNPKAIFFNAADRVRAEWLAEKNRARKEAESAKN